MSTWGPLAVFDLETTGVDVDEARIVSACTAVLDENGGVIARWDWLADPVVEIPDGAAAVHGITTQQARAEGRVARDVVAEITQTLRVLSGLGMPLVVYNAPYDLTLLDRECRRHGVEPLPIPAPVIDPLVIDKAVDRYRKGKRTLEMTAELYGVALDGAHDAGVDAIAAGRVALALVRAYPEELDVTLTDLHGRQEIWYAEQATSFAEYIREVKGDESYVADTSWPMRPVDAPGGGTLRHEEIPGSSLLDTQPIPAPEPRPSLTVPHFDFDTGLIELSTAAPDLFEISALLPVDRLEASLEASSGRSRNAVLRVAAAIITDAAGRTLLVRKRGTTAFMQAGGKIERGESALDTLTRELQEEIGLTLDPDATEYLGSYRAAAANEPDTIVRAEVFAITTDRDFAPAKEIEQLLWLETDDVLGLDLAPLTRDIVLPLWMSRRSALF